MKIIPPISVTDAKLTASNVPETDYTEWSSITSYTTGQTVRVTTTGVHRIYEALTGSTNKPPQSNPTEWLDIGPTNRWAMFDGKVGTYTESSAAWTVGAGNGIQIEILPGEIVNSVALLEVYAESVTVEVDDPIDGIVYTQTVNLVDNGIVGDLYEYFFTPIERLQTLLLTDLPAYGTATVRISIDKSDGAAKCGQLIAGQQQEIGDLLYGAGVGILDFSRKDTDEFGLVTIIERDYSRRASFDVSIPAARTDYILRLLARYRATAVLWVGAEHRPSTIVYGYYRDFNVVLSNAVFTDMTIEVEGLV